MPSRSSRSRPASRTSCSEPTGSASLDLSPSLVAIRSCRRDLTLRAAAKDRSRCGTLTAVHRWLRGVTAPAQVQTFGSRLRRARRRSAEALARLLVAERAGDPGLVEGTRLQAERRSPPRSRARGRCRTSPGRRSRWSSGRRRRRAAAEDARRARRPRRCGGSRAGRRRARAARGDLAHEARSPPRRGCRGGAGRRRAPRARRAPTPRRRPRPRAAPSRDRASAPAGTRPRTARAGTPPRARRGRLRRRRARGSAPTTRRSRAPPPALNPRGMSGVSRISTPCSSRASCGAGADAVEDRLPGDAATDALGGAEDPLEVDGAVRGRLLGVVDDHLPEVRLGAERVRRQHPDLDEVPEVAERGRAPRAPRPVGGQRVVVAPGDLPQRAGAHCPLEVDVQLDLRVATELGHRRRGYSHAMSVGSTELIQERRRRLGRRR